MTIHEIDYSEYRAWCKPATAEEIADLAPRLRDADKQEAIATHGLPAEILLQYAGGPNLYTFGAIESDRPVGLMGYDPMDAEGTTATIWMVSSNELFNYAPRFAAVSKIFLDAVQEEYPLLTNFVDARNTRHIIWLKWCGFKFIRRIEHFGPLSLPFYEFVRYKPCV